jgi:hypothetical protein
MALEFNGAGSCARFETMRAIYAPCAHLRDARENLSDMRMNEMITRKKDLLQ